MGSIYQRAILDWMPAEAVVKLCSLSKNAMKFCSTYLQDRARAELRDSSLRLDSRDPIRSFIRYMSQGSDYARLLGRTGPKFVTSGSEIYIGLPESTLRALLIGDRRLVNYFLRRSLDARKGCMSEHLLLTLMLAALVGNPNLVEDNPRGLSHDITPRVRREAQNIVNEILTKCGNNLHNNDLVTVEFLQNLPNPGNDKYFKDYFQDMLGNIVDQGLVYTFTYFDEVLHPNWELFGAYFSAASRPRKVRSYTSSASLVNKLNHGEGKFSYRAREGQFEILKYLIEVYENRDTPVRPIVLKPRRYPPRKHALRTAISNDDMEIIRYLIERGKLSVDISDVQAAIKSSDASTETIMYLIGKLSGPQIHANNILAAASEEGRLDVVIYAVEQLGATNIDFAISLTQDAIDREWGEGSKTKEYIKVRDYLTQLKAQREQS